MEFVMLSKLASVLLIAVGAYLINYHRKFGREIAEFRRDKVLPLKKASAKEYSTVYLACGIILCLVGFLTLFGVIHFKQ
jgi:hypothetical protein